MSKLQQLLSSVLLLLFLSNSVFASSIVSDKDSLLFAAIVQQDLESLNELLITPGDINRKYGDNQQTLLTFAIEKGKAEASKFLVSKGADIEAKYDRKTPLMFAARYGWEEIAVMLIESGADINSTNRERNTAFHYAAKYNNLDLLKTLFSEGAKINIPNKDSWTALDYSIIGGKKETEEYLRSIGCVLFKKEIPNYFDGPYIELTERSTALINYLANVNGKKGSYIDSEEVKIERGKLEFKGRKPDKNQYLISTDPTPPPSMYEEPPRIFAIGDIHGQYERMVEMLRAGGVIDKQNNWSWGDGHLLFVGDIFDRGEGVMEALWLIYKLEKQAVESNGRVHLLLGNHEVMILKNDIRYLANKYYCLSSNLELDYSELFSERTIMGKWLRTKNVVEVIGETMFIHAGISPELFEKEMTIDQINSEFRSYLSHNSNSDLSDIALFLKGNYGPVWYRGYLKASGDYKKIDNGGLSEILSYYSASKVVVGHTEVDLIEPLHGGRVIPVNIPLADKEIEGQGLLIEDGRFIRVTTDKSKTIIINNN